MQNITLNNGVEIPILGFGVYQIAPKDTKSAVLNAIKAGYRHFEKGSRRGDSRVWD